jgi:hypothetical protein
MEPLCTFTLIPKLPPNLELLKSFKLLWQIRLESLEVLAEDESLLAHLKRVAENLETYLSEPTWHQKNFDPKNQDISEFLPDIFIKT